MSRAHLFVPADAEAWRELIACACRAATDVHYCRPLGAAVKRASKAVFPDQSATGREPFRQLIGQATLWHQLPLAQRRQRAAKLAELARACAVILGDDTPDDPAPLAAERPDRLKFHDPDAEPEPVRPTRRFRADIDG